jgi:hypothetical protein
MATQPPCAPSLFVTVLFQGFDTSLSKELEASEMLHSCHVGSPTPRSSKLRE